MQDLTGQHLGQYRIVEKVGRGGMANVFKAYQPALDRYVAVKVLHSMVADDPQFLARFRREAKAVAALRHAGIVQIHDFGHEDEMYYMVMEFVEGQTLKHRLDVLHNAGEHMSLQEALRIISEIADALDYAHQRGIVHRDIKPANVLLTSENQAVLSDFGIAFMVEGTRYTMTGAIGTPDYMSPEQGSGQQEDARSDIYSMGIMLFEMLTGKLPFSADSSVAVVFKHVQDPLPAPRSINPDIPEVVEEVMFKATSKKPESRFATAGEMAAALYAACVESMPELAYDDAATDSKPVPVQTEERKPSTPIPVTPLPPSNTGPQPAVRIFFGRSPIPKLILILLLAAATAVVLWLVFFGGQSGVVNRLGFRQEVPAPEATPTTRIASTPTRKATPEPSPNPDLEAAAATKSTPSPTPSVIPSPTATPAPLPTLTPTLTPVPTPAFKYGAPVLLEPADETIVNGEFLILKWEPIEDLAEGELYAVRLAYRREGEVEYGGDLVKDPEWRVPERYYHEADGPQLEYSWFVYVERKIGDSKAVRISPDSEEFVFQWK